MKINFRRVGTVQILVSVGLLLLARSLAAKGQTGDRKIEPKVVLSKLFPPRRVHTLPYLSR